MLEIFCAIYPEAKSLIQHFSLKKEDMHDRWDHFINTEQTIRLTLCGSGKVQAAAAVSATLIKDPSPFVLSYGSAAYLDASHEDLYIASSICDIDTGMAYYPDLFWNFGIEECGFLTGSQILTSGKNARATLDPAFCLREYLEKQDSRFVLYDMESSAIYQSANLFVGPHEMLFIRFPSDNDANCINVKQLEQLSENVYERMESVIAYILSIMPKQEDFPDVALFEKKIHASYSVSMQIHQIIQYCIDAGINYQRIIDELMQEEIKDKNEGKRVFDVFRFKCCGY